MSETLYPKRADRPTIYQYPVDVILGVGGTGTVYRGMDPATREIVAIKMFRANFFRNKMHHRDVVKTAKKWRNLKHPNVVGVRDFISGTEGECVIMEYIDGPNLRWYIDNRRYNMQERLVITAQICNGLGFIHDHGFVHHDLKPANVLFTRKGQVKLCDFSLYGGTLLQLFDKGMQEQITPMYVAPEIIRKDKATHLADMYSLGVMLYLMFTGSLPFEVDNLHRLYNCHLNVKPLYPTDVRREVPTQLADIIMKLLEKNPKDRYPSAEQLRIALSDIGKSRI